MCDCTPGNFCEEARRLLARAMNLYETWRQTSREEDWQAYLAAKREYDRHIDEAQNG